MKSPPWIDSDDSCEMRRCRESGDHVTPREPLNATTFKVGGVILPGKEGWRGSRGRKGKAAHND
jgi:hypothetical protein